ncbi:hypothetical protein [Phyllobacterium myrsinacearum]|uniref:Uncharacterized protein n=1 Tax=Phyllobacterium myrsinacearum TaxID=28101 RepID=A0A2S9JBE0_9HYPH|nr:hypothetical protein [Phyllobacterium myrsinacearum]PRD50139.1 hypothetical protein C5750_22715 [Phyllobacterium myrsinacearum]PWV90808.1 hypothetical protein DEV92_106154 [Phyllobacterium myrsinacearum]RZU97210.1 hypothetical protein EV654_4790 [Phyllobacterium myrsinacearum]
MTDYNFWQDLFDTYQSLSDWLKILWLIVPPAFVLGLVALTLRFRIESRRVERRFDGELVYSIHRDAGNQLHVVSHVRQAGDNPPLLFLDQGDRDAFDYTDHPSSSSSG